MRRRRTYQLAILRRRVGGHARRMVRALGGMSITQRPPRAHLAHGATIINYGVSEVPAWSTGGNYHYINSPLAVARSSNKLRSFRRLDAANVATCKWTTSKAEAEQWWANGKVVYARTILCGSRGDGIVVSDLAYPYSEGGNAVPNASLYTCNFNKTHEFRVHVAGGKVIDFVEKKARANTEVQRAVRNHDNGWVFAHDDLSAKAEDFEQLATRAVDALGLDFGGVDVLAKLEQGPNPRRVLEAVVCEVNSSPAWECTKTFSAYQEYFASCIAN